MKTSDAIAAASLFVAAVAFGYTVWASRRERINRHEEIENVLLARRAVIFATRTTLAKPKRGSVTVYGRPDDSIAYAVDLHNAGRATAQTIAAELLDARERPLRVINPLHEVKIPMLPPDTTQCIQFRISKSYPRAAAIRVEWTDEDGPHSQQFAL